jgi:hypothetical protein
LAAQAVGVNVIVMATKEHITLETHSDTLARSAPQSPGVERIRSGRTTACVAVELLVDRKPDLPDASASFASIVAEHDVGRRVRRVAAGGKPLFLEAKRRTVSSYL